MNKYKLKHLSISNFKCITNVELDFDNNHLLIFNGPNGYGKTTVFDALELLLTGKIRRLNDIDTENATHKHSDVLLAKDISIPVVISGLFTNNGEDVGISIRCDKPSLHTKIKEWDNYKLFQLDINGNKNIISREYLTELFFGADSKIDLTRDFNNLFYVEQEENTRLFNIKESTRINEFSKFFSADEAEKLRDNLNNKLNSIKQVQTNIANQLTLESSKLSNIATELVVNEVEFINLKTNQSFDNETLSITDYSILDNNLTRIKKLQNLLQYGKEYLQYINDAKIRNLINDNNKLSGLIYWSNFHDKYNELEKNHSQYQLLTKFSPLYEDFQLNNDDKKINQQLDLLKKICITLDIKHNLDEILNNIQQARLTETDYSKILSSIHSSRESLYNSYGKLCNNHKNVIENDKDLQESNCPFCGYNWNNFELLKTEFEKQTNIIKNLQTDTSSKIQSYFRELTLQLELINLKVNDFINNPGIKDISHFFTTAKNINYPKEIVNFINGRPKLTEMIKKHAINDLSLEYDITDILDKLKSDLSTMLYKPSDEFINVITELNEAYSFIKDSNQLETYLNEFNNSHLTKKINWLNNIYNIQQNRQHKELNEKIEKLIITKGYFDKLCNKLTNKSRVGVIDILDKSIKEYWEKSIKQIEIPLYYYSCKILQHSFRGVGIFISYDRSKDKAPLKFLPSYDTDYDAIFSMSSGQLSVVVIALTLALNLAYGNGKEGGILLIDDPIQSMDDINISALIDLLRHQFTNHQLIFSTHEDEMAMYFNYKFEQLGKKVKLINMKDEHIRSM